MNLNRNRWLRHTEYAYYYAYYRIQPLLEFLNYVYRFGNDQILNLL